MGAEGRLHLQLKISNILNVDSLSAYIQADGLSFLQKDNFSLFSFLIIYYLFNIYFNNLYHSLYH